MTSVRLICTAAAVAVTVTLSAPVADAKKATTKPVGWGPLSSKKAAKLVTRDGYEPRKANTKENLTLRAALDRTTWVWSSSGSPSAPGSSPTSSGVESARATPRIFRRGLNRVQ